MKQKNVIDAALYGRLERVTDERDALNERVTELENALKRIYLGSGVGIQSARAIARKALYGEQD